VSEDTQEGGGDERCMGRELGVREGAERQWKEGKDRGI